MTRGAWGRRGRSPARWGRCRRRADRPSRRARGPACRRRRRRRSRDRLRPSAGRLCPRRRWRRKGFRPGVRGEVPHAAADSFPSGFSAWPVGCGRCRRRPRVAFSLAEGRGRFITPGFEFRQRGPRGGDDREHHRPVTPGRRFQPLSSVGVVLVIGVPRILVASVRRHPAVGTYPRPKSWRLL